MGDLPPLYQALVARESSNNAVSGNWQGAYTNYFPSSVMEGEDIVEKFKQATIVMIQVEKLKKYAKKHKLDLQETLEAFLDPDELQLFEDYVEIRKLYLQYIKEVKKQGKEEKESRSIMDKLREQLKENKSDVNIPWVEKWIKDAGDTSRDTTQNPNNIIYTANNS